MCICFDDSVPLSPVYVGMNNGPRVFPGRHPSGFFSRWFAPVVRPVISPGYSRPFTSQPYPGRVIPGNLRPTYHPGGVPGALNRRVIYDQNSEGGFSAHNPSTPPLTVGGRQIPGTARLR